MTSPDVERIGEILRNEGVETAPPAPGLGAWLGALQERIFEAINGLIPAGFDATPLARPLLWTLVAVGLGALIVLVFTLWRRPSSIRGVEAQSPSERPTARLPRDRDWRIALSSALERGDLPAALEATWWVLLLGLEGEARRKDQQATGRAAVAAAGRADLLPLVRKLEALTYGREPLERSALEPLAEKVCETVS